MISTLAKTFRRHGKWMGLVTVLMITSLVVMSGCSSNPVTPADQGIIIQDLGDITPIDTIKPGDDERPVR